MSPGPTGPRQHRLDAPTPVVSRSVTVPIAAEGAAPFLRGETPPGLGLLHKALQTQQKQIATYWRRSPAPRAKDTAFSSGKSSSCRKRAFLGPLRCIYAGWYVGS